MKYIFILLAIGFGLIQSSETVGKNSMENSNDSNKSAARQTKEKVKYDRLPENIKPKTEVRRIVKNRKGETVSFEVTTVEKRLNELKARYKNNKLVDRSGREIRFFEPLCRGVSRGFEGDAQDQKAKDLELAELEKKYTVLILHCDLRKMM
ncbi:MAG: hypothetical protein LH614_20980 [Pyrinomonadaceae bacterium]|nr:hypothetical protein [Pyrinomonadaceae bacterium]